MIILLLYANDVVLFADTLVDEQKLMGLKVMSFAIKYFSSIIHLKYIFHIGSSIFHPLNLVSLRLCA